MFENEMDILADEFCDILDRVFAKRIGTCCMYDIVDEPNHQTFKIEFEAYDFSRLNFIMKMISVSSLLF
mgnify:CR=1 FL=1